MTDTITRDPGCHPEGELYVQLTYSEVEAVAASERHQVELHNAAIADFRTHRLGQFTPGRRLRPEELAALDMIDALRSFIDAHGIDPFAAEYVVEPIKHAIDNALNYGAGRLHRVKLSADLERMAETAFHHRTRQDDAMRMAGGLKPREERP